MAWTAALRDNLSMALGDGLDKQVIAGTEGLAYRREPGESQRRMP